MKAVANNLHENEKNYRTAVIGVNKNTGEIILVPIKVKNK